jgi:hypothetical protein
LKNKRIWIAIILVNLLGVTLKYFQFDAWFIFLGFRFHLSAVLPFFILFDGQTPGDLKKIFSKPKFRKKIIPIIWLISSIIIVTGILFLLKKIKFADPDYFYEFGLSSIFDYPLYLIWNFPQSCFLFYFLFRISEKSHFRFLNVLIGLTLLFVYEFIPLNKIVDPFEIAGAILLFIIASFFVTKLQNIYWFGIILFSSIWSIILLFGSKSEEIINIFFAREYGEWDGFFNISKGLNSYIIPSFFLVLMIFVAISSVLKKQGK